MKHVENVRTARGDGSPRRGVGRRGRCRRALPRAARRGGRRDRTSAAPARCDPRRRGRRHRSGVARGARGRQLGEATRVPHGGEAHRRDDGHLDGGGAAPGEGRRGDRAAERSARRTAARAVSAPPGSTRVGCARSAGDRSPRRSPRSLPRGRRCGAHRRGGTRADRRSRRARARRGAQARPPRRSVARPRRRNAAGGGTARSARTAHLRT